MRVRQFVTLLPGAKGATVQWSTTEGFMRRSYAIHSAKEAYKLCLMRGYRVPGFQLVSQSTNIHRYQASDKAVWECILPGWAIYLRSNGALDKAIKRESNGLNPDHAWHR